jgi:hypothetical protein
MCIGLLCLFECFLAINATGLSIFGLLMNPVCSHPIRINIRVRGSCAHIHPAFFPARISLSQRGHCCWSLRHKI